MAGKSQDPHTGGLVLVTGSRGGGLTSGVPRGAIGSGGARSPGVRGGGRAGARGALPGAAEDLQPITPTVGPLPEPEALVTVSAPAPVPAPMPAPIPPSDLERLLQRPLTPPPSELDLLLQRPLRPPAAPVPEPPPPEVTVTGKRPPPPGKPPATPSLLIRLLSRPLLPTTWLAALLRSAPLNLGEQERIERERRRELSLRLEPVAVSVARLPGADQPLAEIIVSASTGPRPARAQAPARDALGISPELERIRTPFVPRPRAFTKPKPQRLKAPGRPTLSPRGQQLSDLLNAPTRPPSVLRPRPEPRRPVVAPSPRAPGAPAPSIPGSVGTPTDLTGFNPTPLPLPRSQPFAPPSRPPPPKGTKTCECEKPKRKKPRKQRTECRRGTYTETRSGLIKRPQRLIPCQ